MDRNIFKSKIWKESLHDNNNENGVRVGNVAASKNVIRRSSMAPGQNIHKYTWPSPGRKIHNNFDHIMIGAERTQLHLIRSFRKAVCSTDTYLMVENIRDRLSVRKRAA
jgi:hypothetical protein